MQLTDLITSADAEIRDQALEEYCKDLSAHELLAECTKLEAFRRQSDNLYERVRSLFFLAAIHRYFLPRHFSSSASSRIPFSGYEHLLRRRFEEAIECFLDHQSSTGASDGTSSALASAYTQLAFQTLADQVRRSVRTVAGNRWMFRMGHPKDQPLRFRSELLDTSDKDSTFPILRELTPVRMDLTHSGWSDIFFLGMDYPEGARVLNISVDLGVYGRDQAPRPPVSAWLRVIEKPVVRLVSVDLGASAEIESLEEIFDFAKDYLGLLKAALIASGVIPPGLEGSGKDLRDVLQQMLGPKLGIELVSCVNDIPKGSRLAVSTNLLAALISVCMRATNQTASLTGPLEESERRVVLARALLGEWLGGSGGGWQDSGGVWPGAKLIEGVAAQSGDPEFGISRGRLMPQHRILSEAELSEETRRKLQDSLIVVHGGMAQNVGPILEMVTEKYLVRSTQEWQARKEALDIMQEVLAALRKGDIQGLGQAVTKNFSGPIQAIIPWASNAFTERLISEMRVRFDEDFWGFWMLGGMSGGGMGFIVAPERRKEAREYLLGIMTRAHEELSSSLPFAMKPVVYDFRINEKGTSAELLADEHALMPKSYYTLRAPDLLRRDPRTLTPIIRAELDKFARACRERTELSGVVQELFDALLPRSENSDRNQSSLEQLLDENGFDPVAHQQLRTALKSGDLGLARNRLPASARIEDVSSSHVSDLTQSARPPTREVGEKALREGRAAVLTLAAGAASRWTQGAGVVKSLHPFSRFEGRHRTFLEVHLAKSRKTADDYGTAPHHAITTSYLTHAPIEKHLNLVGNYGYPGSVYLSKGKSVGLRLIPTVRDLRFAWEEMPQQVLDEQQQKVRDSLRSALTRWAESAGEGSDYRDNLPLQCLHPVGHWYEFPNLILNGTLHQMLTERPQLETLMLHNIDTLGAALDPAILGHHLESGSCLTFEVITRRLEDRGGGLALVNGHPRLVEGLALPREEIEFELSYYNSMTTWIQIDQLLAAFGLTRESLSDSNHVREAVRQLAGRMPTYITLKDVKKRWGHGQEDVFPVAQFEKLWSDLSSLEEIKSRYVVVPRLRGQQLKEQAQLDGWLRDGSASHINSLCKFTN